MRRTPQLLACLAATMAVAAAAWAQAPAPSSAPASLARFVPKEKLVLYLEFQGTDAHAAAWSKTAASKILNDTPTGAMLEDLLTQALTAQLAKTAPGTARIAPAEIAALLKHVASRGMVSAAYANPAAKGGIAGMVVFPGAFRDAASKKTFAPLVRSLTPPGGKAQSGAKPGGRTIVTVAGPDGSVAAHFWVEAKTDLVVADDPDAVIAALDGKGQSAAELPARAELLKGEEGVEVLGLLTIDPAAAPGGLRGLLNMPPTVDLSAIKRLDFSVGVRGEALVHDLRLAVPSPRTGALVLLDGPKFDAKTMPPPPDGVTDFAAMSIDPAKFYVQAVELAKAAHPAAGEAIASVEASVKAKSKLRLREDILAKLGPKMLVYASPVKKASPGLLGSLGSIGGGGVQVPKGAMLIEMKDPKAAGKAVDELMQWANREMKAQMAALGGAPPAPPSAPATGRAKAKAKSKNAPAAPPAPEFKITISNPKTWSLTLPTQFAAMTNLRLTVAAGKKYLAIGTMPDAVKEALANEEKAAALTGDAAKAVEGLPGNLLALDVTDPRDTLPEGLEALPATLAALFSPPPPPPPSSTPPPGGGEEGIAAGGRGGRGGRAGGSPFAAAGVAGGQVPGAAPEGAPPGAPPAPPGASPGATPPPPGGPTFSVDPSKIPKAEAIRPLLFPATTAVAVDGQTIRVVVRHAFPDLGFWASLPQTLRQGVSLSQAVGQGGMPPMGGPPGAPPGAAPPGAGGAGNRRSSTID